MGRPWTEEILDTLRQRNPWYRGFEPEGEADATRPGGRPEGVNVCGYLRDESGWGAAGRGYLRALGSLSVPLALMDLSSLSTNRSEDRMVTVFDTDHPYDVNLICVDVGQHFAMLAQVGAEFFDDRYNIGVWAWELPRFPRNWYDRLAYYDEIWVGTSFIANALAPIAPVPVVRIPPVLTARAEGARDAGRRRLGLRPDEFAFVFLFDFHSHMARKNPLAVIDAFQRAFAATDPARLIIKCVNGHSDPEGFAALNARAAGAAAIAIHHGYWTAEEVRDLMAACDAYVSLHRSEGTGLTITDAMAVGKPVIATGWSGNMDFMTVANSYPVQFELVEIHDGVGPYRAGEVWAEPSVEHAAELMRRVLDHPDEARQRGQAARREIEADGSEPSVAALIQQRLTLISHRHRIPAFRREMRAFYSGYQQLIQRIRAVVRSCLPRDATVIVVSKGDDELLNLDGRRAWHFPQTVEGVYAGFYPPDSRAAIDHLEALRNRGGMYLLFPGTSFWWLDHYSEFRGHLETRHHRLWSDDECIIYQLSKPEVEPWPSLESLWSHAGSPAGDPCVGLQGE
jgi:glycosyltransferase involved in cell wall biosynthesis